jgi:hypothetical protein
MSPPTAEPDWLTPEIEDELVSAGVFDVHFRIRLGDTLDDLRAHADHLRRKQSSRERQARHKARSPLAVAKSRLASAKGNLRQSEARLADALRVAQLPAGHPRRITDAYKVERIADYRANLDRARDNVAHHEAEVARLTGEQTCK